MSTEKRFYLIEKGTNTVIGGFPSTELLSDLPIDLESQKKYYIVEGTFHTSTQFNDRNQPSFNACGAGIDRSNVVQMNAGRHD